MSRVSRTIFYKRLVYEWKEKYKMIRSVVDWTIALYFIIPALIFGTMYYRSLWNQIPNWPLQLFGTTFSEWEPEVQEYITFSIVLFALYLVTYFRSIRSFLEEADSLFLLQAPSLLRSIIIRGIVYSFVRICFTNMICIALLLPIFIKQFHFSSIQIIALFLYFTLIRFVNLFVTRYRSLSFEQRWKEWIVGVLFFVAGWYMFAYGIRSMLQSLFFLIPYGVVLVLLLLLLVRHKLEYWRNFFKETARERTERIRWTSAIMVGAGHMPKGNQAKKPRLFPKSKRLWRKEDPESRIIEAFLKDYFRMGDNQRFYLMIVTYSSTVFFVAPWWLSCLVVSFTLFALSQHAGDHWKGFTNKPILYLHLQDGRILLIGGRMRLYTLVPALVLYSIVGISLLSIWTAILLFLLVAGILVRYAFIR